MVFFHGEVEIPLRVPLALWNGIIFFCVYVLLVVRIQGKSPENEVNLQFHNYLLRF